MPTVTSYAQGTPSYVELTTPDRAAATRFYGELFGWHLEDVDLGGAGTYVAVSVDGDPIAGIAARPPRADHPAYWATAITVDDLDATAARVAALGGRVDSAPVDVTTLGRRAEVRDPTGVPVTLWQAGASIGTVRVNEPGCPIWHELTTADLDRATAFYADLLGVEWQAMPMPEGPDYLALLVAGRPVGGAFPPPVDEIPPHWEVYFCVEDADATAERAVGLGGTISKAPWDVPGVGRLAILRDPHGAVLGLMEDEPAGA